MELCTYDMETSCRIICCLKIHKSIASHKQALAVPCLLMLGLTAQSNPITSDCIYRFCQKEISRIVIAQNDVVNKGNLAQENAFKRAKMVSVGTLSLNQTAVLS